MLSHREGRFVRTADLSKSWIGTNPTNTDQSVTDTIARMIYVVRHSAGSLRVRDAVLAATKDLHTDVHDTDVIRAIYYWVKANVQYVTDENINMYELGMDEWNANDVELLITPDALLSLDTPKGDCDDFSMLLATMLVVMGYSTAFVTIAADKQAPGVFSHVYVKVWVPDTNSGLYLDCSHGTYPGWEYSNYTRKKEWRIN